MKYYKKTIKGINVKQLFLLFAVTFSMNLAASEKVLLSWKTWKEDVKTAIQEGKSVESYWTDERTPVLHRAAREYGGDGALARMIIESGYDVTKQDSSGRNVLIHGCLSVLSEFPDLKKRVLTQIIKSGKFENNYEYTYECVRDEQSREFLIQQGIEFDINQIGAAGPMVFHLFQNMDLESFKKLEKLKPNLSLRSKNGESIFHMFYNPYSLEGLKEKFDYLVASGVNINARDNKTITPLIKAAIRGSKEKLIRLFVEAGAIIRLELKDDVSWRLKSGMNAADIIKLSIDELRQGNSSTEKYDNVYRYLLEQDDLQRM